jgi:hypothetical protein
MKFFLKAHGSKLMADYKLLSSRILEFKFQANLQKHCKYLKSEIPKLGT